MDDPITDALSPVIRPVARIAVNGEKVSCSSDTIQGWVKLVLFWHPRRGGGLDAQPVERGRLGASGSVDDFKIRPVNYPTGRIEYLETPSRRRSLWRSARIGPVLQRGKKWARAIKRDAVAVWIAARDPRVPWYAKVVAAAVAAYALSPIDLIPDFIPVLGYIDDLIIVPAGILLTIQLIPDGLMDEFREEANRREGRPISRAGAVGISSGSLRSGSPLGCFVAIGEQTSSQHANPESRVAGHAHIWDNSIRDRESVSSRLGEPRCCHELRQRVEHRSGRKCVRT